MRERWRRAIWTIMMHNRACKRLEDRWYINVWVVAALAGGQFLALASYLQERDVEVERHHQLYEVHPNLNQKPDAIIDSLTIAEEPPPKGGEAFWAQMCIASEKSSSACPFLLSRLDLQRRCYEDISVLMTSGSTSSHLLYS